MLIFSCKKENNTSNNEVQIPTLTTTSASSISISSIASGGTIIDNGGNSIISKGIVWNTSPNPTITLSSKTIDGSGNDSFISFANNLHSGTTYYYRAYAVNSVGVGYGNELTITTLFPDVFIAGLGYISPSVATVWKNGIANPLTTGTNSSKANSIFIKDNDIYVGGSISTTTGGNAAIWKNGVMTLLPLGDGVNTFGVPAIVGVNAVTVSGTDIYAAGNGSFINSVGQSTPIARYWKNGNAVNIVTPNTLSNLYGIAVNGTDVYLVGSIYSGGISGGFSATVWKNGIPTTLILGSSNVNASANGIFINGNDIYICGNEQIGSLNYPRLWKNNIPVNLTTPLIYGRAGGLTVYNDTVYVVGTSAAIAGTNDMATVWKNGIASYLPKVAPNSNSYAKDIKIIGGDIFISGNEVGTGAMFWKNGIGQTLPSSGIYGQGNAIFVK